MNGRVLSEEEIVDIREMFDISTARNNKERGESIIMQNLVFTIRDLQRQLAEHKSHTAEDLTKLRLAIHNLLEQNQTMHDFIETLKERAQNDINMFTKQGQHVGVRTFASLQGAREVMAVCNSLAKVKDA